MDKYDARIIVSDFCDSEDKKIEEMRETIWWINRVLDRFSETEEEIKAVEEEYGQAVIDINTLALRIKNYQKKKQLIEDNSTQNGE